MGALRPGAKGHETERSWVEESRGERSGANDPEEVVVGVECLVAREEPSWWQHINDNHASTAVLNSNQQ